MRQFIYWGTASLFLFCTIISCKKGDQGPAGPQGQQGTQGAQGAQGVQGPAGSKIYSGNGAHAASTGVNGDFYLDLSAALFYGPKTDAGWGTAISLKGAQGPAGPQGATGAQGASGSQILSGTGAPAASLGNNGDFYLDKSSYSLYGPKAGGSWGAALLLQGPAGPQGPAGTANVIYSTWFTPSSYVKDTIFGIWGFNYNQAAPGITQQVLDQGVVITYAKLLGYNPTIWPATQVGQLPVNLTYLQGSTTYVDAWSATATVGNLRIRMTDDHNFYSLISNAHQFRYVIIPGGTPGGRMATRPDYKDYAAVCRFYGIPE